MLAELGGDDPLLLWRVHGFLLPPASAKLKVNALSLVGSREGFHRAARSGSTVLCCCYGCEVAQLYVTCQLLSLSASPGLERPPVISFEWCRVWSGGSLREKHELFFLCCLQVSADSEVFPGVWAGRCLVLSWGFWQKDCPL